MKMQAGKREANIIDMWNVDGRRDLGVSSTHDFPFADAKTGTQKGKGDLPK